MKKNKLISLLLCAIAILAPINAICALPVWESVKSDSSGMKSVIKEPEIEILTAPSCITVNSIRQVDIKVFTILGRLVSAETLPPGSFRLIIPAHGVYIVKAGETTCKVAI